MGLCYARNKNFPVDPRLDAVRFNRRRGPGKPKKSGNARTIEPPLVGPQPAGQALMEEETDGAGGREEPDEGEVEVPQGDWGGRCQLEPGSSNDDEDAEELNWDLAE